MSNRTPIHHYSILPSSKVKYAAHRLKEMREELSISEKNFQTLTDGIIAKDPLIVATWESMSTEPKWDGKSLESVFRPKVTERKVLVFFLRGLLLTFCAELGRKDIMEKLILKAPESHRKEISARHKFVNDGIMLQQSM